MAMMDDRRDALYVFVGVWLSGVAVGLATALVALLS